MKKTATKKLLTHCWKWTRKDVAVIHSANSANYKVSRKKDLQHFQL